MSRAAAARSGSLVTSSAMPVTTACSCALPQRCDRARRSSRPTSPSTCRPVGDDHPAVGDHACATSAAVAAMTSWPGRLPAVRALSSRTATRSARAPGAMRPASGQPSARCPATVSASTSSAGRKRPRSPGDQPLVQSRARGPRRTGRSRRAGRCRGRAGSRRRASRADRADAVGEVGLGGRADADRRAAARRARRSSSPVRWVACTAVVSGPSTPGVGEQPGRGAAVAARQASFSAGCSERCTCSGAAGRRPAATGGSCSAGTARTECMAAPIRRPGRSGQQRRPGPPRRRRRRRRTAAGRRPAGGAGALEAAGEVAGVEQGEPDPGVGGGLRPAPRPSRSGRRTGRRPAGGAGSGTRRRR